MRSPYTEPRELRGRYEPSYRRRGAPASGRRQPAPLPAAGAPKPLKDSPLFTPKLKAIRVPFPPLSPLLYLEPPVLL